ncbi:hypothetical protein RHGRI_011709 [Rhododendron griersonianum]|uniref:Protein kinase domain-containing protein n=1 Tax=Rhododendron griersonianum TaxID=479676 RepID=A0AAV6KP03_9ERIC|nr:hypothetical protein RHGRI_011709 [Rhododendron griersonianum]
MRHGRVPSVRGVGFGKPRREGGTEGFRRHKRVPSVRLCETEVRRRHGRVPSVRGFGFEKPRHEGGTEGFCRFVGSASGNRGTKEARKGSVGSWVRLRETEARRRHIRAPLICMNSGNSSSKSSTVPATRQSEGEILESSNLKSFTFSKLKNATRNFCPDSVLGEGGFGSVFKGWIDERSLIAAKPGTGLVIAMKRLNQEGFQGHKEWLDYNAKLSDFGLARDGPTGDKSYVSTRVMGTIGYAAPEYLSTGHLTAKSDVFSFGVVLLEMLTGKRAIDKNRPSGEHNLVEWAKLYLTNKRRILGVMDARLEGQYPLGQALKAGNLALQCLSSELKYKAQNG